MRTKEEIKKYLIDKYDLDNAPVFLKENTGPFKGLKIAEIRSRYPNNRLFAHIDDGSHYEIVFVNAYSYKGNSKIKEAINSYPELSKLEIEEIILNNRLWKHIGNYSSEYQKFKIGDTVRLSLNYDLKTDDLVVKWLKF